MSRHDEQQPEDWRTSLRPFLDGGAPQDLHWNGDLRFGGTAVQILPRGLHVDGDLDFRACRTLRALGAGTRVGGALSIGGPVSEWRLDAEPHARRRDVQCLLEALPSGLKVGGALHLTRCNALHELPADLDVGGSIHLARCAAIESLPEALHVHGDLHLSGLKRLRALPRGLRIDGDLVIRGSAIESLPDDMQLGGNLSLHGCRALTRLPSGLHVRGNLTLSGVPIEKLPSALRVDGTLDIGRVHRLRTVPGDLVVGGHLRIERCNELTEVAGGLRVGRDLEVRKCRALRTVQTPLDLGGSLLLPGCDALAVLPDNLQIPGSLNLHGCRALQAVPGGLRIGSSGVAAEFDGVAAFLDVRGCELLTTLPIDLDSPNPLALDRTGIRDLPDSLLARKLQVHWRGLLVPARYLYRPHELSADELLSEPNAELRRFLLEQVGVDSVLSNKSVKVVDEDVDKGGPRRLIRIMGKSRVRGLRLDRRRLFLHCRCPSTGREFALRVPPNMRSCHQAAAWLAGFDNPDDYRPVVET